MSAFRGVKRTSSGRFGRVSDQRESQQKGAVMSFYEKGPVRIHFEEKGSGFPLLMIAGGGLNSTIPNLSAPYSPLNAMDEFKHEYRCIGADLRNANDGQS